MTRPFEKAQPGEPFEPSAAMHNATIDLINRAALQQFNTAQPSREPRKPDCWIKNTEATTCERFAPIGIADDEVFIEPPAPGFFSTPVLKGIFPTAGGQIAVALEPIPENKIGPAYFMGLVPASIEVSDAGHTLAKAVDSEFKFESSATEGSPILWKQSGTGTKFGYVLIGSSGTNSGPSKVAYVQAPIGGMSARTQANRPSKTECEVLAFAPVSNLPYFQSGDLLATGIFIDVQNWTDSVAGAEGSRLVQVDNHIDGESQLIGFICNDTGDPDIFDPWPPSHSWPDPSFSDCLSEWGSDCIPDDYCHCRLVFEGGRWTIVCTGICPSTLPSISAGSPPP
jgi:hypothetical protein